MSYEELPRAEFEDDDWPVRVVEQGESGVSSHRSPASELFSE